MFCSGYYFGDQYNFYYYTLWLSFLQYFFGMKWTSSIWVWFWMSLYFLCFIHLVNSTGMVAVSYKAIAEKNMKIYFLLPLSFPTFFVQICGKTGHISIGRTFLSHLSTYLRNSLLLVRKGFFLWWDRKERIGRK